HDATIELSQAEVKYLSDSDVIAALLMAIIGVCALQAGYYWFQKSQFRKVAPVAELHLKKSKALLYCVLVGIIVPLLFTFRGIIPEEYQQPLSSILRLLQNQVLVVIGVLGWLVYSRRDSKWYLLWMYALVAVAAVRGISTGTLEEALVPIGVLFMVRWLHTRRISVAMAAAVVALILFFSPVKAEYRQQVWLSDSPENAERSSASKALLWIEQAAEYWGDTLSGSRNLTEATASASGRADFIHQIAHIYSMTPSVVPYQYGETYSYFAIAMIPRIVWPDKPQAGSANGFYAVSYGITSEEGAKTTTFGVSILGESFMNFGWYGIVLVMLLQGIIISLLERVFGGPQSGPGGQAVFIAFFIFFLNGIGSSAEIVFGNILQNLLCGYFLLLWAREKPAKLRSVRIPLAIGQRT
ncbi:MAG TPA: hypothetical protein VN920_08765, partial [Pyrinomonadaceae bacterium]|nr:hypothetical protein [Pyrinomonadaceae bacterium]